MLSKARASRQHVGCTGYVELLMKHGSLWSASQGQKSDRLEQCQAAQSDIVLFVSEDRLPWTKPMGKLRSTRAVWSSSETVLALLTCL